MNGKVQSYCNMGKDLKERACIWEVVYLAFIYLYILPLAEAQIHSDLEQI